MGVKELYQKMDDKWYKLIDKIDTKIPIYGIIDKIDSVIPSFALFLIIIIFLLLFVSLNLFFAFQPYNAVFLITDFNNNPVNDSMINFDVIQNGKILESKSLRTTRVEN